MPGIGEVNDVARQQWSPTMAPEAAEVERRPRTEEPMTVEATADGEMGATTGRSDLADAECRTGGNGDRCPHPDRDHGSVGDRERGIGRRTGEADHRGAAEPEGRSSQCDLEAGGVVVVAHEPIADAERAVVHRSRRGHSDVPVPEPAGMVLDGGERAAVDHLDAGGRDLEGLERTRGVLGASQSSIGGDDTELFEVGLDATDAEVDKGFGEGSQCGFAGRAGHDDLGEERVVVRADLGTRYDPGVDAGGRRRSPFHEPTGRGSVADPGILGVDTGLERATVETGRTLDEGTDLAGSAQDHPLDEVDAGDRLGNGVLDLKSRVDLEERRLLAVGVIDELDCARRSVRDRASQSDGGFDERCPNGVGQARSGGLLDHLLVAALQRAVAVAEGDDLAESVAEHLDLDVTGVVDIALEEDAGIGEVGGGERRDGRERGDEFVGAPAESHADAAAPGRALEHDRESDPLGGDDGRVGPVEQTGAGEDRNAVGHREVA
jgi:hypothetical protein